MGWSEPYLDTAMDAVGEGKDVMLLFPTGGALRRAKQEITAIFPWKDLKHNLEMKVAARPEYLMGISVDLVICHPLVARTERLEALIKAATLASRLRADEANR